MGSDENVPQERRHTNVILLDSLHKLDGDVTQLKNLLESFMSGVDPEAHRKQHEYLDLVIEREKERAALRKAIIEKTLISLLWSAIVGISYAVYHTFLTGKTPS